MKARLSKAKRFIECLSLSLTLSYTITKKKKRFIFDGKVINGSEAPEGSLRVLFRFRSDMVLFNPFMHNFVKWPNIL